MTVQGTSGAFAALSEKGFVKCWGDADVGADKSAVEDRLKSGVKSLYSTLGAFVALKDDSTIVAWGDVSKGGDISSVTDQLVEVPSTIQLLTWNCVTASWRLREGQPLLDSET